MIFDGRKIEIWMKKNYSIDDMFIWCIYVSVNSNNEQWINNEIITIKNIIFNWFLIWFELLVFSDVNGLHSHLRDYSKICKVQTLNFMVKKTGEKNDIK